VVEILLFAELQRNFARVRLSRNSVPQTPPCVGAFALSSTPLYTDLHGSTQSFHKNLKYEEAWKKMRHAFILIKLLQINTFARNSHSEFMSIEISSSSLNHGNSTTKVTSKKIKFV